MRETNRRQALAIGLGVVAVGPALLGGDRPKSLLGGKKGDPPLKIDETVGDLAYVRLVDGMKVEGPGLVIGLAETGSNPEPVRGPRQGLESDAGRLGPAGRADHGEQADLARDGPGRDPGRDQARGYLRRRAGAVGR